MPLFASTPEVISAAGKVAVLSRDYSPDDPRLMEARRRLSELRLEAHIQQAVSAAPPLTDEQRARLAELLAPIRGGDLA
ncbi:hypothetical protein [Mycolicibacterium septicum]|uniref:hypothetical protein n=1 Tax=Mycolicibacterium septicum TaxID=98668 RepID=UPI001AFAF5F8|nr:hypothetical protein [Mycolicibacterium septicum]QRY53381.1 hypothetical protein JVX95_08710 [Mycolicibacterium septicum]